MSEERCLRHQMGSSVDGRSTGMTGPSDVTRTLSGFVCGARWEQLPDTVRHEAKRSILNFIATTLAGCREERSTSRSRRCASSPRPPQATIIGRAERVDALSAAFLNAAAAISRTSTTRTCAPSSTRPRQSRPRCSRLPRCARQRAATSCMPSRSAWRSSAASAMQSPGTYARGWHITSTCGTLGAAAASRQAARRSTPDA